MMFWTWVRSVFGAMNSRSQISGVDSPSVSARRTSSSRGVSGSIGRRSSPRSSAVGDAPGDLEDDRPRQERLAGVRGPDGLDDVVGGPVLREVAVGAGLDRLEDRLVVREGRQHHDPRGRPAGLDRARRLGAGAVGQAVVHQDDVDAFAGHRLRVGDAAGDADDLDVRFAGEHRRQCLREEPVVLDEQHTDRLRLDGHAPPGSRPLGPRGQRSGAASRSES